MNITKISEDTLAVDLDNGGSICIYHGFPASYVDSDGEFIALEITGLVGLPNVTEVDSDTLFNKILDVTTPKEQLMLFIIAQQDCPDTEEEEEEEETKE